MMTKKAFVSLLKEAKEKNFSPAQVSGYIKYATGVDMPDQQVGGMMDEAQGMNPEEVQDSPLSPEDLAALGQGHPEIPPEALQQIAQEIASVLAAQSEGGQGGGAGGEEGIQAGGLPPELQAALAGGGQQPPGGAGVPPQGPEQALGPDQLGASGAQSGDGGMPKIGSANLSTIRGVDYIEGFLKTATDYGMSLEDAIDTYGDAYYKTVNYVKEAQANEAGINEIANKIDDKTAAYCQGIIERADSLGMSMDDTVAFLKQGGVYDNIINAVSKQLNK